MPMPSDVVHRREERIKELHRCRPGRTALVVIDMQRGFLEPGAALEVPQGRQIVPNLQRLIRLCRAKNVLVVYTQFVYSPSIPCLRGDPFGIEHLPREAGQVTGFGRPSSNCLVGPGAPEGPDSADIVPELAPADDEPVIAGHTYDKFYGTPLDLVLRTRDVRWLILGGVTTDICVNSTLMAAANRDYRVTALTDGVATLWPEIQEACLRIWQRKFARLRTTDEMMAELETF